MDANGHMRNAPHFLVRTITEEQGDNMPSFLGHVGWAASFLIPNFAPLTLIFYR
jgi:hypothetical protein